MRFQEHHFRNLGRARDHLSETILSLQSALDRMTGDDWIDATELLNDITEDIGPRLGRLRTAASERFDEHTRLGHFEEMRTGRMPFPDERLIVAVEPAPPPRPIHDAPRLECPTPRPAPNWSPSTAGSTRRWMAYPPDSAEFDHIQAYRYVSTGKRPHGWIPPTV